jgi:N-acetylglucosamine-6-phosphate deacetylase
MKKLGFVDLQVNGLLDMDFGGEGLTLDMVRKITEGLVERGTAAYCATVVTGSMEMYKNNLPVLADAIRDPEIGPRILGIHLEGPFISPVPGAVGAHNVSCVRTPSVDEYKMFEEWAEGNISILTLAPEMPAADKLISYATSRGCVVSLGHHWADNDSLQRAVDAGARLSAHLGNGCPNEVRRHDNPIWWQLACDDLSGSFITDGHHLPADFIKVALRAKTLDHFIVISDASFLAAMPVGKYGGFGKEVEIEASGRIFIPQTQALGGSHSTMIECMNHLASLGLLSEDEMWKVAQTNPLNLLGRTLGDISGPFVQFDCERFTVVQ